MRGGATQAGEDRNDKCWYISLLLLLSGMSITLHLRIALQPRGEGLTCFFVGIFVEMDQVLQKEGEPSGSDGAVDGEIDAEATQYLGGSKVF